MLAPDSLDQLIDLVGSQPNQLASIQQHLNEISDDTERRRAEDCILLGYKLGTERQRKHIIVLIHGIRTHAIWQEQLTEYLKRAAPEVIVIGIGYGNFKLMPFLLPHTRAKPISVVLQQLRIIRTNHLTADISVVAHSFGTYMVSKILEEYSDVKLHRIQLCGSIISANYDWSLVMSRVSGTIVNDVGTEDIWPWVAKNCSVGYGDTGLYGFKKYGIKDNFHRLKHSHFFSESHMQTYWIPFLADGQVRPSEWNVKREYGYIDRIKFWVKLGGVFILTFSCVFILFATAM